MKHSVKAQLMVMFTGLLGCLVVAFLILNIRFLEPYYINDKENQFVEMYEQFNDAMKKDSIYDHYRRFHATGTTLRKDRR